MNLYEAARKSKENFNRAIQLATEEEIQQALLNEEPETRENLLHLILKYQKDNVEAIKILLEKTDPCDIEAAICTQDFKGFLQLCAYDCHDDLFKMIVEQLSTKAIGQALFQIVRHVASCKNRATLTSSQLYNKAYNYLQKCLLTFIEKADPATLNKLSIETDMSSILVEMDPDCLKVFVDKVSPEAIGQALARPTSHLGRNITVLHRIALTDPHRFLQLIDFGIEFEKFPKKDMISILTDIKTKFPDYFKKLAEKEPLKIFGLLGNPLDKKTKLSFLGRSTKTTTDENPSFSAITNEIM